MALQPQNTSDNSLPHQEKMVRGEVPGGPQPTPIIDERQKERRDMIGMLVNGLNPNPAEIPTAQAFRDAVSQEPGQDIEEIRILTEIYYGIFDIEKPEATQTPEVKEAVRTIAVALLQAFRTTRQEFRRIFTGFSKDELLSNAQAIASRIAKKNSKRMPRMAISVDQEAIASLLDEIQQIPLKSEEELLESLKKVTDLSGEEAIIFEQVKIAAAATNTPEEAKAFYTLAGRLLTLLSHGKRPQITEVFRGVKASELKEISVKLFAPSKPTTDKKTPPPSPTGRHRRPTGNITSTDLAAMMATADEIRDPKHAPKKEEVTRKFAVQVVPAVLDARHLEMRMAELLKEKIMAPESPANKLLEEVLKKLKELENSKSLSKEVNEKTSHYKRALKDLGAKIIHTVKKSAGGTDQFRILDRVLKYMGNRIEILASVLALKSGDDVRFAEAEIREHRDTLPLWTDENNSQLTRARTYFENGEKSLMEITDEERSEKRVQRLKEALVDCSSLIILGVSTTPGEKTKNAYKAKVASLLKQIEVDAQGLEIEDLEDESAVGDKMKAHLAERAMDEDEKARASAALDLAKKLGEKEGLKAANQAEENAAKEQAATARKAGLLDFGNIEGLFDGFEE